MRYPRLGATGMRISEIILGTSGAVELFDEATFTEIIHAGLDCGVTAFDTADAYDGGAAEQWLGRALGARRDDVVISTKAGLRVGATAVEHGAAWHGPDAESVRRGIGPNDRGLSRKHLMAAAEASLRRLGTDYIDLYQIHQWDPYAPMDETLEALSSLIDAGKVRYIGCSRLAAWQLHYALGRSAVLGLPGFVSMQVPYSMLARQCEAEVLEACEFGSVGVLAFSVFAGGMLGGLYPRGASPAPETRLDKRPAYLARYWNEHAFDVVDRLRKLGADLRCSPAQLALAWVLARPTVNAAIVGADSAAQVTELAEVAERGLAPDELAQLDAVLELGG
jgi:aryl-alcohol dehydrogenase-like predicted oxidoreductase